MKGEASTRAFAPFEWLVALRYLRARRKEGFISVIAGFSFLGITLGVATLIIVMAVMNGFRQELFNKIVPEITGMIENELGACSIHESWDGVAYRLKPLAPDDKSELSAEIGYQLLKALTAAAEAQAA